MVVLVAVAAVVRVLGALGRHAWLQPLKRSFLTFTPPYNTTLNRRRPLTCFNVYGSVAKLTCCQMHADATMRLPHLHAPRDLLTGKISGKNQILVLSAVARWRAWCALV